MSSPPPTRGGWESRRSAAPTAWRVPPPSRWNPASGFATATYSCVMGAAGIRIHDFLSSGTGDGLQLEFDLAAPAKIVVTRLR